MSNLFFANSIFAVLLTVLLGTGSFSSSAQYANTCIDSTYFPDEYAMCNTGFTPVCGCDGATYNNADCAYRKAGVVTTTAGPCGTIAAHVYPNPTRSGIPFMVQVRNKYEDDINIEIKDLNGMLYLSEHYSFLMELDVTVNVSGFPRGLYFMFVYNNTEFVIEKFMVWEP